MKAKKVCLFVGVFLAACASSSTAQESYFEPGYHPCDTDQDAVIGDWELLHTIDGWAVNERLNNWPKNLDDYDWALLELIDLWAVGSYNAWVGDPGEEEAVPVALKPVSNTQELELEISFPGIWRRKIFEKGIAYDLIRAQGCGMTDSVGLPLLPVFTRYVSIPPGSTATLAIMDYEEEVLEGYSVFPVQEPLPDIPNCPKPLFAKDEEFYLQGDLYPASVAELSPPVVVRGHDLSVLRVNPASFDPETGSLTLRKNLRIRVSFSASDPDIEESRLLSRSSLLDEPMFLFPKLLNFNDIYVSPKDRLYPWFLLTYADVLIITAPEFLTAANNLADWKRRMGYFTRIRQTGPNMETASEIRTYSKDAYDTWAIAPSFVILLGDADLIPTDYLTAHPSANYPAGTMTGTDLYYTLIDGDDWLPDIAIGRIPVDTAAEAATVVSKIIDYERTPPRTPPANWNWKSAAVAAYFQDNPVLDEDDKVEEPPDGNEDRRFVLTSEEIRDDLRSRGYAVRRLYCANADVTPTHYIGGWDPLPSALLKTNGFAWDADTQDVIDAINGGIFYLVHRDHGSSANHYNSIFMNGWGHPSFQALHVAHLTNVQLPVVFSINCETGWFDGETDFCGKIPDPFAGRNYECLCEELLRREGAGAVGVIGATRISYSGYNDDLANWWHSSIFSVNVPPPMGQVLNNGKLTLVAEYSDDIYRRTELELFHYFGDPTMRIWTSAPATLTVSHPQEYSDGTSSLEVTVSQDDAMVCLLRNGQILARRRTKGGKATFSFSPALSAIAPIEVTVSKPKFRPYEGLIFRGWSWVKTLGGTGGEGASSVQQTSDGGYIVAGYTNGFGAGLDDVYLIKADGSGNEVWSTPFGGSNHDTASSVQQTSDGGYIVAGTTLSFGAGQADVYLVKTNPGGSPIWSTTLGGSGWEGASSVQQSTDGGYILAGQIDSVGGDVDWDVYLVKTSPTGTPIWSNVFGGNGNEDAQSVQQTSDGGYILAGVTEKVGGAIVWDVHLIKTDANGHEVWTRTFGGPDPERAYSVQQTSDGGYIVAGYTRSFGVRQEDVYLIKTDAGGNEIWSSTFGGNDDERAYSVEQTTDGGYIVAGWTRSFGAGESDVYLIKTDAGGNEEWSRTFGGTYREAAESVQQTADGGYIVAGFTETFGAGGYDVFLIKTDRSGNAQVPIQPPGLTATRTIFPKYPEGYMTITVTIQIDVDEANAPSELTVRENLPLVPSPWNVTSADPAYDVFNLSSGEIRWVFTGEEVKDRTLTYTFSVRAEFGPHTFGGKLLGLLDGAPIEVQIGGDDEVNVQPPV